MKNFKLIVLVNLLLLFIYTLIFSTSSSSSHRELEILIAMCITLCLHCGILFIISIYNFIVKNNTLGKTYLLCTAIIGVIGFSTCIGAASL